MIQKTHFEDKKSLAKHINNYIYQILKEYGYKKNGNEFYLKRKEFFCIINIQKNRYTEPHKEEFTLNWGLHFLLDQYFYNEKPLKKPSFNKILVGGRLIKSKKNLKNWWTLSIFHYEIINKQLKEVAVYLKEYLIPFLLKLQTIEDVIEMLESTKGDKGFYGFYPSHTNPEPFQAILYLYINKKEKSLEIMDEIIATTKSKLYRENMELLKEKIKNFDPKLLKTNGSQQ